MTKVQRHKGWYCLNVHVRKSDDTSEDVQRISRMSNISRASGKILLNYFNRKLFYCLSVQNVCSLYNDCIFLHILTASTNKHLALNLTFYTIYFSSPKDVCSRGNLTFHWKIISLLHIWAERHFSRYCGYHPTFLAYPGQNYFHIITQVHMHTVFVIDLFYSVMDQDFVRSRQIFHPLLKHPVSLLITKNKQIVLFSYFIQVQKLHRVVIRNHSSEHAAFGVIDGPEQVGETLTSANGLLCCSTFQCTLQVLVSSVELLNINYSSVPLHYSVQYFLSNITLVLPDKCNDTNPCVIFTKNMEGLQINATIFAMRYTGNEMHSPDCTFGGLLALRHKGTKYNKGD